MDKTEEKRTREREVSSRLNDNRNCPNEENKQFKIKELREFLRFTEESINYFGHVLNDN